MRYTFISVLLSLLLFSCAAGLYTKTTTPAIMSVEITRQGLLHKLNITVSNPTLQRLHFYVVCAPRNVEDAHHTKVRVIVPARSDKTVSVIPDTGVGDLSCWLEPDGGIPTE